MIYKIHLKNSDKKVLLDPDVFEFIDTHNYYGSIKLLDNLRLHSTGCCVFQKAWPKANSKGYKYETIYLHKLVAEKYLEKPDSDRMQCVVAKNGDKLDCRLENLEWRNRDYITRRSKAIGKVKFRGVSKDYNKYRAEVYTHGERIYLGLYDTAEEAAAAYEKKIKELFGDVEYNKTGKNKPITKGKISKGQK